MDNEMLAQRLESMLAYVEEGVKASATFAAEQAPLVVQEYLAWYFWGAVVWATVYVITLALIVASVVTVWRVSKRIAEHDDCTDPAFVLVALRGTTLAVAVIVGGFTINALAWQITSLVKVSVAPRVVVLEQIGKIIK